MEKYAAQQQGRAQHNIGGEWQGKEIIWQEEEKETEKEPFENIPSKTHV